MATAINELNFPSPTTAFPTQVQNLLQLFQGLTVYILTLRNNSACNDEASQFIRFYMMDLSTPIVYESLRVANGSALSPKFNRTKPVILPSKFNHQSLQLFLPAFTKSMNARLENIGYIRNIIYACKETANYYVIFASKSMRDAPDVIQKLKAFKEISAPARFLFVWDLTEIEILCVFCPFAEDAQILYPLKTPSSIKMINELDRKINRNMLHTTVQMTGKEGVDGICPRSINSRRFDPVPCAVYEIIARANATINFTRSLNKITNDWDDGYVSHIIGGLYPGYALILKSRRRKIPFEWAIVGEKTTIFSFVNVVETRGVGVSAIWRAFDLRMWLIVLAAALSMAALLTLSYRRINASVVDNFKYSLALVFSLAIERFAVSGARMRNSTMLLVVSVFAWAQLSSVLNTSYKGYLFSTLASKSTPDVPRDMEALASTPALMFATTYLQSGSEKVSFFHYQITEVLRLRNRTNDTVGDVIEQMSHRLLFSELDKNEAIILQASSKSNGTRMRKWDNSTVDVKMPKNHIFVGILTDVIAYTYGLGLVSSPEDHPGFVFGEGLPLFLHKSPMFIQPNFFQRIFIYRMFDLVQSGIWDMWQRAYVSATLFLEMEQMVELAKIVGVRAKSVNGILLQLSNEDFRPPKPENTERPLTLDFMGGPLQALGLGLALALSLFVYECILRFATVTRVRPVSYSGCNDFLFLN